jgi:CRP-like cAMP-binding protein
MTLAARAVGFVLALLIATASLVAMPAASDASPSTAPTAGAQRETEQKRDEDRKVRESKTPRPAVAKTTAGEIIYTRGSPGDELFGIGSGRVDVLAADAAGREQVVNSLGVGTLFGGAAFFSGRPRETTVRAGTDVLLFALRRADYEEVLERSDRVEPEELSRARLS